MNALLAQIVGEFGRLALTVVSLFGSLRTAFPL